VTTTVSTAAMAATTMTSPAAVAGRFGQAGAGGKQ
jgi:hypothetical protein